MNVHAGPSARVTTQWGDIVDVVPGVDGDVLLSTWDDDDDVVASARLSLEDAEFVARALTDAVAALKARRS